MKTIENIFNIDFLTYLLIFICLLTGHFKKIIIYMALIIFHELGHFLTAKVFNWKVDKIYIYPLGGITKFNEKINKPLIEEFLVTIMGPLFQVFLCFVLSNYYTDTFYLSNLLLFFNLLPIVPLDGSRLLSIFFSIIMPYKKNLENIIKLSYLNYLIAFFLFFFLLNSKFMIIVEILLIFKIIEEKNKINYYFNKFLLERYLNKYSFRKIKIVNKIDDFYKYKNNVIRKKRLVSEKEVLEEYFKNR